MKVLQRLGYKITFAADNLPYHDRYTPMLQGIGIEVVYAPYATSIADYLKQHGSLFDVVVLSRADCAARHIDVALECCPQARVLFDTVDLHFLREQRLAELSGSALQREAALSRKLQELSVAHKAHTTLVVSPVELELFRNEAPDVHVALLSNIHATAGRKAGFEARRDILFIGSFEHPPNADAMHWFIDAVWPLVRQRRAELNLKIVGGGAPPALVAKADAHIQFTGFIADIAPLFDGIRVSIAPLRYGAGVKGKINSSLAHGVPVIATTVAAEGMGLVDGVDVLIADEPQAFADALLRAYDDAALWLSLSDAGLASMERHFSFAVAERQLRAILA
jgi:glycosyltransferase involved in cell wall biosynthesis